MVTFTNNLDQDEAQQIVGPHLRYKLFVTGIFMIETDFFAFLKEDKYEEKKLACKGGSMVT